MKKFGLFRILPGSLFVVLAGIGLNALLLQIGPEWGLSEKHLVALPIASNLGEFFSFFKSPDFSALLNPQVYVIALTLALVGSLETLLSVEATDKLDENHHITPTNRELKAQGIGNMVSGMIGGLPITQVIVRSSANINSGAKSKLSAIIHGLLLLILVALIPTLLNKIPLASLAAILILVGYKLANIALFKQQFSLGWKQFLPFVVTIVGILFTNLLAGIGMGMAVAIFYILQQNFRNDFKTVVDGNVKTLILAEEVSFLNKGGIMYELRKMEENSTLRIDGSKCRTIDYDVLAELKEFINRTAVADKIKVEIIQIPSLNDLKS